MNCLGSCVIFKSLLWKEEKKKKDEKKRNKSHVTAPDINSLDQLVYEFTQQAFYVLSQKDPGTHQPSRIRFKKD